MSQPVASKNLYELLGNDPELDPDREPEPPTKTVDKPQARSGKRTTGGDVAPKSGQRGEAAARAPRENFSGNERAIRDRTAGAANNRAKPTEDGARPDRRPRDSNDRGRGSRGGSSGYASRGMRGGRPPRDDRHSKSGIGEHDKQAAHGWGENTAEGELNDETTGLADARKEEGEGIVADDTPVDENGAPAAEAAEPEDKSKSYEQYLAEQLEKKAALNDRPLEVRKPNEGSSKKFPEGKAIARGETEEEFIAGSGGKNKRTRERKEKNVLDIDQAWIESDTPRGGAHGGPRGGRGGARGRGEGGRGRGEGRGRGGARGGRGGGEGRGERGDHHRGEGRGAFRGGRGQGPNIANSSDFPSLGA